MSFRHGVPGARDQDRIAARSRTVDWFAVGMGGTAGRGMPMLDSHTPQADFYDPRGGGLAVRVRSLDLERGPHEPARTNYFAVYRVDAGAGTVSADDVHCPFDAGSLLFS